MVIAFQTLFLGLLFGATRVSVMVAPQVHTVQFVLDGEPAGTVAGAPWWRFVGLGPEPHPHLLEAVARDASDHEVGRARQWLNRPGPNTQVGILLDRGRDPRQAMTARVSWEDVKFGEPSRITATLDGTRLPVRHESAFSLPPVDPAQTHVLSVELEFPEHRRARADVAFGGDLAGEAETELTAVPVALAPGRALPSVAELQGCSPGTGILSRSRASRTGRRRSSWSPTRRRTRSSGRSGALTSRSWAPSKPPGATSRARRSPGPGRVPTSSTS
jgi:hypothetical protein